MKKEITGIILAGGKSSRIGQDKGLLKINGKTLVEQVHDQIKEVCDSVILISNQQGYEFLGIPIYNDIHKEKGPIGGIHSGLTHSNSKYNLIVSCDMPNLSVDLFNFLIKNIENDHEAIVPVFKDEIQPLCGIYCRSSLVKLHAAIESDKLKMKQFLEEIHTKIVYLDDSLDFYSDHLFTNINTRDDLNQVIQIQ